MIHYWQHRTIPALRLTLPYKEDWLTFTEVQKRCNVNLDVEAIPIADYSTKVSLALNTGENVPDVILYQSTTGENASLALNGALVPISDYSDWTPNFNARVEEMDLQDDVDMLNLQDGKRYYMPSLTDKPFYDGGLILREDYLESKGLEAPKTFDDLYEILKAYKADYPDSYPLTILAGPRVLFRMTMPSFGISVGKNSADGSYVLSYDYDNKDFFAGAIDDKCKEYFAFLNKLYSEGLLDPEMADPIDGDKWSQKLATGSSMATYAYYDQIGGVEAASEIDGFKLQMYAPLEGPAGAHHQPKSRTGSGIMFPKKTAERDDFERMPRFISTVVVIAIMNEILSPSTGLLNNLLHNVFGMTPIYFMNEPGWFRPLYILSESWQYTGWTAIIYLAAITGISSDLYEAAEMDGATRLQQIFHVTIPSIMPTIMVMLIMNVGRMLSIGYEKVLLMYTPSNSGVSDIIDTLVYRTGLQNQNYSYATAIGLFGGIIGLILVSGSNAISKKLTDESLY